MSTYPNTSVCTAVPDFVQSFSISVTIPGYQFGSIIFAAFGISISGSCGNFFIGPCSYNSTYVYGNITKECINKTSCTIINFPALFIPDPCPIFRKFLVLELKQVDINECEINNGGCSTNPPVTCYNTPGSYYCGSCPDGYSGDGYTCTDINECNDNNGNCGNLTCINYIPGYHCLPTIISGTQELITGAANMNVSGIYFTDTRGGQVLQVQVNSGTFTLSDLSGNTSLLYGPPSLPEYLSCTSLSWIQHTDFIYNATCTLSPAVGIHYHFTFLVCVRNISSLPPICFRSYDSLSLNWSYPYPIITVGTLNLPPGEPNLVNGTSRIAATNSLGENINFHGQNFVGDFNLMNITYGPIEDPYRFICKTIPTLSNDTSLTCLTQVGGSGEGLLFTLRGDGYEIQGQDQYNYQPTPIVDKIEGCTNQNPAIVQCPTTGGVLVTIIGNFFTKPVAVLIDSIPCTVQVPYTDRNVTCILPPGIGLLRNVLVNSKDQFSPPLPWVSFAPPKIIALSSNNCNNTNSSLYINNCPREGNVLLTIKGDNFGETGGSVLIANQQCIGLIHLDSDPHRIMFCTLPSGIMPVAAVIILQGGQFSSEAATVGYYQCPPGTFQQDLQCLPCQSGYFSVYTAQTSCTSCLPGFYNPSTYQSTCLSCPSGTSQNLISSSNCSSCLPGFYTASPAQLTCSRCLPGLYADTLNSTSCIPCQPGTYQFGDACAVCPSGKYSSSVSQTICTDCLPGLYNPTTNATNCTPCGAGYHQIDIGSTNCTSCLPGFYSASPGQLTCSNCLPGLYASAKNATTCLPCQPGTYQFGDACTVCPSGKYSSSVSQTICTDCLPGLYNPTTNATNCTLCGAGYHQIDIGSTNCTSCLPGFYSASPGQLTCSKCIAGTFNNESNSSTCPNCPEGSYSDSDGSTHCKLCINGSAVGFSGLQGSCPLCSVGRFAASDGLSTCSDCISGYYQPLRGASSCELCPLGKFSGVASDSCLPCPAGSISLNWPNITCLYCLDGAEASDDRTQCLCPSGKYGKITQTPNSNLSNTNISGNTTNFALSHLPRCLSCPAGSECTNVGVEFETLETRVGWWHPPNSSALQYYQCLHPTYCLGGANSTCGGHHTGVICALCEPGRSASSSGSECSECPSKLISILVTSFFSIAVLIALCIMYYIVLRSDQVEDNSEQKPAAGGIVGIDGYTPGRQGSNVSTTIGDGEVPLSRLPTSGGTIGDDGMMTTTGGRITAPTSGNIVIESSPWYVSNEFVPKPDGEVTADAVTNEARLAPSPMFTMKIILGFLQIVTNLVYLPTIPWPKTFQTVMSSLSFININFVPWQSVGCAVNVTYYTQLLVMTLTPPLLILLLFIFIFLPLHFLDQKDWRDSGINRLLRQKRRQQIVKLILFTLFLTYPSISSVVLSFWHCHTVQSVSYLVFDFGLQCYDNMWFKYLPFAVAMLLIYPIGVPGVLFVVLYRSRKMLKLQTTQAWLGFLYAAYYDDQWWFELVDMLHKLFLTSILRFVSTTYQIPVAMLIVILFLCTILYSRPYLRYNNDILHILAQVYLYLILLGAAVSVLYTPDPATDIALSVFLLIICFLLLCFCIGQLVFIFRHMFRKYQRKQALRLEMREEQPAHDSRREPSVSGMHEDPSHLPSITMARKNSFSTQSVPPHLEEND